MLSKLDYVTLLRFFVSINVNSRHRSLLSNKHQLVIFLVILFSFEIILNFFFSIQKKIIYLVPITIDIKFDKATSLVQPFPSVDFKLDWESLEFSCKAERISVVRTIADSLFGVDAEQLLEDTVNQKLNSAVQQDLGLPQEYRPFSGLLFFFKKKMINYLNHY